MKVYDAIIIGAGPAGLTFTHEYLSQKKDASILVLEKSSVVGGLSRTVEYEGNHIDIGGHRFYTKSARVQKMFDEIGKDVFLKRRRLSRIYFNGNFFSYPLKLSVNMLTMFGIKEAFLVITSYLKSLLFFPKNYSNLEDFFISRFGRRLYEKFFKEYTEKVWGLTCRQIDASWGAQRVKDLSLKELIYSFFIGEKNNKHTSLIHEFLYPKLGPGQFWSEVKKKCEERNVDFLFEQNIESLEYLDGLWKIKVGNVSHVGKTCMSSMPLSELIMVSNKATNKLKEIAEKLEYRDFVTVGLELEDFHGSNAPSYVRGHHFLPDNWIYIQDRGVKVGRVQIFNNWSPYMVSDIKKPWVGLEYFCQEDDDFWKMSDEALTFLAKSELQKIGLVDSETSVIKSKVIRAPKAYPKYTSGYKNIKLLKNFIDEQDGLYSVGRNAMHRYNNQDHSMLAAMKAVDHITGRLLDKSDLWDINTESSYGEEKG